MSYYRDTYLKSGHWQNLRIQKLATSDARCCICGARSLSNDVHHITYGKYIHDVRPEDLRVVCRTCHDDIHEAIKLNGSLSLLNPQQRWAEAQRIVVDERRSDSKFPIPAPLIPFISWCAKRGHAKLLIFFCLRIKAMINYQHAKLSENSERFRNEKIVRLIRDGVSSGREMNWLSSALKVHAATIKRHPSFNRKNTFGVEAQAVP